ncbi:nucleotide sugar dehydrogenase [Amycolatopsis rhizosphaerae]|uniref:Nucleotide sugar dehydrogenase n=1 Tax=Amycolatopsis rhizosphaerae TaxID=2053003 RepID=A0A558DKA8_9PSEU|nr:nucleotide sugar dehydrogenase [Amycolatopsis rhizosphaerae]TVT61459.1 nucleotide sugar dehydrogenase [Amycolatopsis rhizosphaerae]
MRFLPHDRDPSVLVVGAGYVGLCLGVLLAQRGLRVVAADVDRAHVERLRAGRCAIAEPGLDELLREGLASGRLTVAPDLSSAADCDVVLLTPGTPIDADGRLDSSQLEAACRDLAPRLRPGQLVVVKCTVPPGTTRTVVAPLLAGHGLRPGVDVGLAHCPERLAEGQAIEQLRELAVVVGGIDVASAEAASAFWRRHLGVPVHPVADADVAEAVKLASNWWIDHNIAMANELALFCDAFGIDVMEVVTAANTIPKGAGRMNVLLPSVGVGGSCLPKDPVMAVRAAADRGVELRTIVTGRAVNDAMPGHAARSLTDELRKLGTDPAGATVAVLGLAFKSDTGDLRRTPVAPFVECLRRAGCTVRLHDGLAEPERVRDLFGQEPEPSIDAALAGADAVAFLAGHREYRRLTAAGLRAATRAGCLVFDGRRYFTRDEISSLHDHDLRYRGIGR